MYKKICLALVETSFSVKERLEAGRPSCSGSHKKMSLLAFRHPSAK